MKKLKIILRSSSGRNNLGRLTLFTKGGGLKKYTHLLDFRRKLVDMQCKVRKIEYAANRSARVCLICSKNGVLSYVTATKGIKVGDVLFSSKKNFLYKNGDNISLKFVQIGSMVHNVELYPGAGAVFCRSAGSFAKVWRQSRFYTHLKFPSGEERLLRNTCKATLGMVANEKHKLLKYTKAGINRNLGRRPKVRGIARNPVDHPNGGKTKGGQAFRDVWGHSSEGHRLLKKKRFSRLILKKRR